MKTLIAPKVVQVIPFEDYTVDVYFEDGKIVRYDMAPFLESGVFKILQNKNFYMTRCTILNDTLAWDVTGTRDEFQCIDIDPETLYSLPVVEERIA